MGLDSFALHCFQVQDRAQSSQNGRGGGRGINSWEELKGKQQKNQGLKLGGIKPGMVWIGMGPHLTTIEICLTAAMGSVRIAVAKRCSQMTSHVMIALLSNGNSGPNCGHKSWNTCICSAGVVDFFTHQG